MNEKTLAEKLVEALRSGDYEQTRFYLRYDGGFCCIGVMCDVYRKETGNGEWVPDPTGSDLFDFGAEQHQAYAPPHIWAELAPGMSEEDRAVAEVKLNRLNDRTKLGFSEIADVIEAVWVRDEYRNPKKAAQDMFPEQAQKL